VNSLRNRLSLSLSLVLLVAAGLLAFGLQDFPRRLMHDYVLTRLRQDAELLYAHVLDATDPQAAVEGAAGTSYELPLSGRYFVIRFGREAIHSRSLWDEDLGATLDAGRRESVEQRLGPAGQSLLVYARRFAAPDGGIVVQVAEDIGPLDAAIDRFRTRLLIGVALALLALLALQRRLLVRGLAPLDEAVRTCRRLERGEVPPSDATGSARPAPSEVQPILDALGRLARHHARRLGRIRHAAGNLSHALKTPLASLGHAADDLAALGQPQLAADVHRQLDAMRETIERELHRARLAGAGAAGEPFEARVQLAALAQAVRRLHRDRAVDIAVEAPDANLPFDREDMLELIGNLLDNACKWARSRARVTLSLAGGTVPRPPEHEGTAAVLAIDIEDDGPGVPEPLLERIGTAGLRGDERRPGHGMGLAIVGDIVAQYEGTIRYQRSTSLGGLHVAITLPMPPGHEPAGRSALSAPRPGSFTPS